MSLSVTTLDRVFKFRNGNEDVILPDPNPDMQPDEVMDFYSATYTELTTATIHGP
jgi:PRTRC genetic system protein C